MMMSSRACGRPAGGGSGRRGRGGTLAAAWRCGREAPTRSHEPERGFCQFKFKLPKFEFFKFKLFKQNFKTVQYKSCRGANHLQFLQRVLGVLWTGFTGNVMPRWGFSQRGQKTKLCVDPVFGGFSSQNLKCQPEDEMCPTKF
jgi:hypothetical protein